MATLQNLNFVPTSIAGCQLWLDGTDPAGTRIVPANGSTLSSWVDKSGNGRTLGVGSGTTTYSSNSVRLNTSYMFVASPVNLTNATFFIVTVSSTSAANQPVFTARPNTLASYGSTDGFGMYIDSSPSGPLGIGCRLYGQQTQYTNPSLPTTTNFMMSAVFGSAGTLSSWINGGSQLSVTYSARTSTAQGFAIGAEWNGSSYTSVSSAAYIYEVLVYNAALTTAQRQQIEGYLAWKWGLASSLPSDHPFKLIAPNSAGLGYPSALTVPVPLQSFLPVALPLVFFNPTTIAGLQLWLDASDRTSVITSGTNVTQWNDKSGSGNTAVAGTLTYPVYSSNSLNSLNTITLQGSNDYFFVNNNFTYATYPYLNFFVVFKPNNATQIANSGVISTDTISFYGRSLVLSGSNFVAETYSNFTTVTSFTANTWYITDLLFTSNTSTTLYVNGTGFITTTTNAGSNTSGLLIGVQNNSVSYTQYNANIDIAEILIYTTNITAGQRQQIEGYLAWKWNLASSLPSNHPYKMIVPGTGNIPVSITSFQPVSFRPTSISGLQLWLDATNQSSFSFSSGTSISTWTDRTSNLFTGSAIGSPSLTPNVLNSLPAVSFNGSSQYINFGNILNMGTNQLYIFVVSRYSSTASGNLIGKTSARTNVGRYSILRDTGSMIPLLEGSAQTNNAGFSDTSTSARILLMAWNRSVLEMYENGTSRIQIPFVDSTNLTNTDSLFLGAYPSATGGAPPAGFYFNGFLMEILLYQSAITVAQRQQVEGYLAWKWGLQGSLPATHPFKNFPPPPN